MPAVHLQIVLNAPRWLVIVTICAVLAAAVIRVARDLYMAHVWRTDSEAARDDADRALSLAQEHQLVLEDLGAVAQRYGSHARKS